LNFNINANTNSKQFFSLDICRTSRCHCYKTFGPLGGRAHNY
jgi:hypothetical protein